MRVYWKVDGTKNGVDEYKNATYEQIEKSGELVGVMDGCNGTSRKVGVIATSDDKFIDIPLISLTHKKKSSDERLVPVIKVLQKRLELLINMTPSGAERNTMTEENICVLTILKCYE